MKSSAKKRKSDSLRTGKSKTSRGPASESGDIFGDVEPEESETPMDARPDAERDSALRIPKSGINWFLGSSAVLLVGMVLQLGLLVYAMYVLLGVLAVSRYLTREWVGSLEATRECNQHVAEIGDKIAVVVNVKNTGKLPIAWMLIEDSLPREALKQKPPRIKVERKRQRLLELAAGAQESMPYQVTFQMRGYYQIGPLLVESGDLFGLHRKYLVLTEPHFILVYPKVVALVGYQLASRRPIGEIRLAHRLFEDPTRISGVRQYQQGDPLNRIHWRATARTGVLHSKTYEPSSVAGMSLLLDFHTAVYNARGEPHRSELAITTVASLANAMSIIGQQVGFFTNGRDAVDRIRLEGWKHEFQTRDAAQADLGELSESDRLRPVEVPTQRGTDQFSQILETLARVELTDGLTFPQLAMEVAARMPRDATVIAILPGVSEDTAISLGSLRRRGFAVTAILVMFRDETNFAECVGRLLTEGIEVRHVESEQQIANLCAERAVL